MKGYADGVSNATLALTLPGIQTWTIACNAGMGEKIGRLIGIYKQEGDEYLPDFVDVIDYGDAHRSRSFVGTSTAKAPSRGELQERVNAYVDALYAELDESHQTVAKLTEHVGTLKTVNDQLRASFGKDFDLLRAQRDHYRGLAENQHELDESRQTIAKLTEKCADMQLQREDAISQFEGLEARLDALKCHESQTGEILNQRVATLNDQVNKQDYLINELRDEETRLKRELAYWQKRVRTLSEVNEHIGDENDWLRSQTEALAAQVIRALEALGWSEIPAAADDLIELGVGILAGEIKVMLIERDSAYARMHELEDQRDQLKSRNRVDVNVTAIGLDILNAQLDAVVEKIKVLRGGV